MAATTATVVAAYNNSGEEESILGNMKKAHCMTIAAVVGKDDFDARYAYVCSLFTVYCFYRVHLRAFFYLFLV